VPAISNLFHDFGSLVQRSASEDILALDARAMVGLLLERGVLLFRGFSMDTATFEEFTRRFSDRFIRHGAAVRQSVSPDGTTQTVTGGNKGICLHREMHFSPFSPDMLWFYCDRAPQAGGETTVGDGARFFSLLSAESRATLEQRRIKYRNVWTKDTCQVYFPGCSDEEISRRLPALGMAGTFEEDGSLIFDYTAPGVYRSRSGMQVFANSIDVHMQYLANVEAFQVPGDRTVRHGISFEDGTAISAPMAKELEAIGKQLERPLAWQSCDLVMIDNTRVMHGRRDIPEGSSRSIYLRMAMWPQGLA
jgi:alpha-ketoglutarate-dependent taurine dioxygenase